MATGGDRNLAVDSRAARDLIDRGRRWASAHSELAYIPPPMPQTADDSHRPAASRPFAGYADNWPAT